MKILNFQGSLHLTPGPFYRDSIENPQFGGQKSKLSKDNFRGEFPPSNARYVLTPLSRSPNFDSNGKHIRRLSDYSRVTYAHGTIDAIPCGQIGEAEFATLHRRCARDRLPIVPYDGENPNGDLSSSLSEYCFACGSLMRFLSNSLMGSFGKGHCSKISANFCENFRRISAPFPDAIKRIFCNLPRNFRKLSAKTPSLTTVKRPHK